MLRLFCIVVFVIFAKTALADEPWEEHNGRFCGGAQTGDWETVLYYASERAEVTIPQAFQDVRCRLSPRNSDEYVGNMWHASIRLSPNAMNVSVNISKYFLKDNPSEGNRQIFISLVRGDGVDHGIFHAIQSSFRIMPGRRDIAMHAARVICMSIDRYDITELYDIRQNECATPPFVEPWRIPSPDHLRATHTSSQANVISFKQTQMPRAALVSMGSEPPFALPVARS